MKTFLEHTRDQQEEGLKDMAKGAMKSAGKAVSAVKNKVTGGEKKKGPGLMDRIKSGAKKVVQAVGREFQKGKDAAKAERPPKDKKAKQQAKVDKVKKWVSQNWNRLTTRSTQLVTLSKRKTRTQRSKRRKKKEKRNSVD